MKRILIFLGLKVVEISALIGIIKLMIWIALYAPFFLQLILGGIAAITVLIVFVMICYANWRWAGDLLEKWRKK